MTLHRAPLRSAVLSSLILVPLLALTACKGDADAPAAAEEPGDTVGAGMFPVERWAVVLPVQVKEDYGES